MQVLKSISSIVLATLVLLSSMGFFVDHMVCQMSGEHKLAINKPIESCTDSCPRGDTDQVDNSCCDYDSFYFKDDSFATSADENHKPIASQFAFVSISKWIESGSRVILKWSCIDHSPDWQHSVSVLILFQIFLI